MTSPLRISPRTLVVVCADWSVRAAGLAGLERPVAVWSHRGIEAANPTARAAGVRVGQRRREAQGRCPEMELVAHDPARDARCFEPVIARLTAFTPQVEIVEPGIAAFKTRGPSRYFGGDDSLTRQVLDAVAMALATPAQTTTTVFDDARSDVRVGVADGPLVAHLAALRATPGMGNIVVPGGTPAFVAPLGLTMVAPFVPDRGVLTVWNQLGLRTLGDLARLPIASVAGRFGPDGTWVHRLARGDDPTVVTSTALPDDVDEIVGFDPPELRAEAVAFAARSAATKLTQRLEQLGMSCAQVAITLSSDHAEELTRRWRLDGQGPTSRQADALIAERVRWQADGWLAAPSVARPTAGIIRLRLAPGQARPARGRQVGFWGGASAPDERAMRTVARLEALAGPDAVCMIVPRGGRDPNDVELVPTAAAPTRSGFVFGRPSDQKQTQNGISTGEQHAPWPGRLPSPSPATVLDKLRPIDLVDVDGTEIEVTGRGELTAPPARVTFRDGPEQEQGQEQGHRRTTASSADIIGWAGPWPVDERWWDPGQRRRHARMQLVTADGEALLVTRRDRRWWLVAIYR